MFARGVADCVTEDGSVGGGVRVDNHGYATAVVKCTGRHG